jgi:SAM-dependent methyltransferase
MVHHNNCPLCKNQDIDFFTRCKDYLVSREEFDLFRCHSCGFIFTQDYPGEEEIGRYYESSEYISHSDSHKSLLDKVYQLVRKFMLNRKKRMVRKVCNIKSGSILDIGSGTGHFLNTMKLAGWTTSGIEISKMAREYGTTLFGFEMITPAETKALADKAFDCITMWHVMEHFQDPAGYFADVKRLLKPGGTAIVALPNNSSADARHYGSDWAAYDVPRHLWHFNCSTFSLFAGQNGFTVTDAYRLPFDVFYISILSERIKQTKLAPVRGIFKGTLFSLSSIFDKEKSSSLVYILKYSGN